MASAESDTGDSGGSGSGRLDLSVELSSPQVFSGSVFSIYLHVRNPFARPVWIRRVTTHLPADIYSLDEEDDGHEKSGKEPTRGRMGDYMSQSLERLTKIERRLAELDARPLADDVGAEVARLTEAASEIHSRLRSSQEVMGGSVIRSSGRAFVRLEHATMPQLHIEATEESQVGVDMAPRSGEDVLLRGSLPLNTALQPGSDNVWTITLATRKNPFFLPAAYKLNLSVLYTFDAPSGDSSGTLATCSNTAPATVNIRSSLWSVMGGSVIGGVLGASARLLQQVNAPKTTFNTASVVGPILLAIVLSIAAAIFAARKSETQSFVSVEDFWGGALVGFLIGYSGTAAFESLTRIKGMS